MIQAYFHQSMATLNNQKLLLIFETFEIYAYCMCLCMSRYCTIPMTFAIGSSAKDSVALLRTLQTMRKCKQ